MVRQWKEMDIDKTRDVYTYIYVYTYTFTYIYIIYNTEIHKKKGEERVWEIKRSGGGERMRKSRRKSDIPIISCSWIVQPKCSPQVAFPQLQKSPDSSPSACLDDSFDHPRDSCCWTSLIADYDQWWTGLGSLCCRPGAGQWHIWPVHWEYGPPPGIVIRLTLRVNSFYSVFCWQVLTIIHRLRYSRNIWHCENINSNKQKHIGNVSQKKEVVQNSRFWSIFNTSDMITQLVLRQLDRQL